MIIRKIGNNSNLIWLFVLQAGNAIFPLLLYPFIFLKIGPQKFSDLAFSETIALVMLTFGLFGFDVLGVVKIGQFGDDKRSINQTFFDILFSRISICFVATICVSSLTYFFKREIAWPVTIWSMYTFGSILQSNYYFQAIQKNFIIAIIVLTCRTTTLLICILLVKSSNDFQLALLLISGSYLSSGVIAIFWVLIGQNSQVERVNLGRCLALVREAVPFFAGSLVVFLYRGSNVIVLGFLNAPAIDISIYAVSERYIKNFQAIVFPISQFFSAKFSKVSQTSIPKSIWNELWLASKYQITILLVLIGFTVFSLPFLSTHFLEKVGISKLLVLIMLPAVLFGTLNYLFGIVAHAKHLAGKQYFGLVICVGVLHIPLTLIAVRFLNTLGAALTYQASEIILFVLSCFSLYLISKRSMGLIK